MDGSSFYAHHSEFYLVQVNTHTDFGDLMQQLDRGTWGGRKELFINRNWHHCTTGSAKALVWCFGSQYHENASSALLVIWYLWCSIAMWSQMGNDRIWILKSGACLLRVPRVCCSNQHVPILSHDISSQRFLYLRLLSGWTLSFCLSKFIETRLQSIVT